MLRVEKIETLEALRALETSWNSLVMQANSDGIFLSHEWFSCWWKVFAGSKKLFILTVKSDNALVAIAPLMISSRKRLGRVTKTVEFIGRPDSVCYDFIALDMTAAGEEIVNYLVENVDGWDRIEFSNIPGDSRFLEIFKSALSGRGKGFLVRTRTPKEFSPASSHLPVHDDTAPLKISGDELAAFKSWGELEFEEISDLKDINSNMPVFFQLHINSRRHHPQQSKFNSSLCRRFYYELSKSLAPSKRVSLLRLRACDIPVSYGLCFVSDGALRLYDVASNPLFGDLSPDLLFIKMVAESCRKRNFAFQVLDLAGLPSDSLSDSRVGICDISAYAAKLTYKTASIKKRLADFGPIRSYMQRENVAVAREKLRAISQKQGFNRLLVAMINKALETLGHAIFVNREYYVYRHSGGQEKLLRIKVEVEVRKFCLTDINRIASFYGCRPGDPKYETFKKRFEKGADCYVALHHGYPVCIIWGLYHEDYHSELNLSLKPAAGEVIISDALTAPIYRSMGIAPYLFAFMLNDYHESGYRAIAAISKSNMPSRKGLEIYDFKHVGTLRIIKIFGIRII